MTDYEKGLEVGEQIAAIMPTLREEDFSMQDFFKHKRLTNSWFNEKDKSLQQQKWEELSKDRNRLTLIYLPPVFEYRFEETFEDLQEFLQGIKWSLWDSDFCSYNLDNILIKKQKITLFLK